MAEVNLGTIYATLEIRHGQVQTAVNEVKTEAGKLVQAISPTMAVAGQAIGAVNDSLISIGRTFTSLPAIIAGVGFGYLATQVVGAGIEFEKTNAIVALIGKNLDITDEQMKGFRDTLGAVGITGGSANKAIQEFLTNGMLGLERKGETSAQLMGKLAEAARNLAFVSGKDTTQAFELMTMAIARGNPLILKQLGIVFQNKFAMEDYAKSLGKTSGELTELEKSQYVINQILDQASAVQGAYNGGTRTAAQNLVFFKETIKKVAETFSLVFMPAITSVLDSLSKYIQRFTTWVEENKGQLETWGKQLSNIATQGLDLLLKAFSWLVDNKEIVYAALLTVATGIAALVLSLIGGANPVTLAVFAAFTAFYYLLQKYPQILDTFRSIWEAIQPVLQAIWDTVKQVAQVVGEQLYYAWISLVEAISPLLPILQPLAEFLGVTFAGIILGTIGALLGLIAVFANVLASVITIFGGIIQFIQGFFQIIIGIFTGNGEMIRSGWSNLMNGLLSIVQGFIQLTIGSLVTFFATVIGFFVNLYERLTGKLMPDIASSIIGGWNNLIFLATEEIAGWIGWIYGKWGELLTFFDNISSKITDAITKPFSDAWSKISEIASKIKEELDKISPFHKESPSLVENVEAGVGLITDYYERLNDLLMNGLQLQPIMTAPVGGIEPTLAETFGSVGGSPTFNVTIGMYAGSEIEKRNIAKELNQAYQDYQAGRGQDVNS